MSDNLKLQNYTRPVLKIPNGEKNLLLHSCCAPCSGEIIEGLAASKIKTTVYFYNPNIHPVDEYEIRKEENRRFCEKVGFDCIDGDYDKEKWFERIKGLENEPERKVEKKVSKPRKTRVRKSKPQSDLEKYEKRYLARLEKQAQEKVDISDEE